MDLKGSKTERNLWEAFSGESQARNKYTFYSGIAKKAGYEQMAAIFTETADNEKEHAELWFKLLNGIGTPRENLLAAAEGEHYEWSDMYKRMEKDALEEGFPAIAKRFKEVAEVEEAHEKRYRKLVERLDTDTVFKENKPIVWKCRNCGYHYTGADAPNACPACSHAKAYFERLAENY